MSVLKRIARTVAWGLCMASCTEVPSSEPRLAATPTRAIISLELYPVQARAGDTVEARVRILGQASSKVGSVTALVLFDTSTFGVQGQVTTETDAMRAVRIAGDSIRVATVSSRGLGDPVLIAVRLLAKRKASISALRLHVSEIHAVDGSDLRSALGATP